MPLIVSSSTRASRFEWKSVYQVAAVVWMGEQQMPDSEEKLAITCLCCMMLVESLWAG